MPKRRTASQKAASKRNLIQARKKRGKSKAHYAGLARSKGRLVDHLNASGQGGSRRELRAYTMYDHYANKSFGGKGIIPKGKKATNAKYGKRTLSGTKVK